MSRGNPGHGKPARGLLNAGTGSTLNLTGGFIPASNGGQVTVDPATTNSLITLHGGITLSAPAASASSVAVSSPGAVRAPP